MNKIYSLFFLLFIFFTSCKQSEESKIQKTCTTYIEGRIAFENGDTLKIKPVVGDTLYRQMLLNRQYSRLLESDLAIGPELLTITPKTVEIKGNKATCIMNSPMPFQLNLVRSNDQWKIVGENEIFPNAYSIAAIEKKISDYKVFLKGKPARDPVFQITNRFFYDVNNYCKNNNLNALKNNCDDATADFVKHLYEYAKKRSGADVINEEINNPHAASGDISFKGDLAYYMFYQENASVLLKKTGDTYKVIGFNGIKSASISNQMMEDQYVELLRAVRLVKSEQYRNKNIK
ncbi:hypothetical protein [Flavobacterium limi]|uniref:Lipoprotein n=1 Tax=Flavobacterium limi TaxID=2045105 RepID=A0ABQ1TV70_9FLAO|nr:hypothetical protein [Flavobacterium limi]GGF04153.1 hypothetical protein GCM10011518_11690 [Flavobacterium limi]